MSLSKNDIIAEFSYSKDFCNCIAKMQPEHLRDDLKSEVLLALLEKEDTLIKDLHQKKQLHFYAARIIINMTCSSTSPFFKKYRQVYKDVEGVMPAPEHESKIGRAHV